MSLCDNRLRPRVVALASEGRMVTSFDSYCISLSFV